MDSTPESEQTMTEVLDRLVGDGYTAAFRLAGGLRCPNGCHERPLIESTWRFEGRSDPDDESIVLAVRCPTCGVAGAVVAGYGSMAAAEDDAVLASLGDRPRHSPAG